MTEYKDAKADRVIAFFHKMFRWAIVVVIGFFSLMTFVLMPFVLTSYHVVQIIWVFVIGISIGMGVIPAIGWCLAIDWKCTRMDRYRANQCVDCAYDLRASPQNVCPECGHDNKQNTVET